ncbi:MAG: imidazolonepropionase [Bacteroidota bacterium]|nr:imidazolonepropionase [Odoribacter sp.]MDP3643026.1 imidazolonepropionase [Bacteroidota bacterium]
MVTKLIGPFAQIVTMCNLPLKGALSEDQLEVIAQGGVVVSDGKILAVGIYTDLETKFPTSEKEVIAEPMVLLPGFVDAHTHICFAGDRANDYAMRISGKSYQEIALNGGGISSTVTHTRNASEQELTELLLRRCDMHLRNGITTCEVKSGYGLSVDDELKMLRCIQKANQSHQISLISTCLAAHTKPAEFSTKNEYINFAVNEILPQVKLQKLSNRVDIFVDTIAFDEPEARFYLDAAKRLGFEITVHADQFSSLGSRLAIEYHASSADHLEASSDSDINLLAKSDVVGVLLPGASMGLGMPYAKGREMLDKGMCIAIASDWNPGSAPMGDLLTQAAVFGASEKFTTAETFAALTFRAAKALQLSDRGSLSEGSLAHLIAFPCKNYREILYYQGSLKPTKIWC